MTRNEVMYKLYAWPIQTCFSPEDLEDLYGLCQPQHWKIPTQTISIPQYMPVEAVT